MTPTVEELIYDNVKSSITEAINLIQKYGTNTDGLLSSIKETSRELCEAQLDFERCKKAVANASKFIEKNNDPDRTIDNAQEIYNTELNKLSTAVTYKQHDFYKEVVGLIDGDCDDTDSQASFDNSIICTSTMSMPNDPITKGPIKNPCRNTVCKHIYDLDSIKFYIHTKRKGKAKCPYVGCVNSNIRMTDIVPEPSLSQDL